MIDAVASDYQDSITFLAVAGRSDFDSSAAEADRLFSDNLAWGLDESIWDLFGIIGQPASVLISGDDIIVDTWFGAAGEAELRERLDFLASL